MRGLLFDIKRYAIHDGPGIRVTFFMKGCPLKCLWCHNPEGISGEIEQVERIDRIGEKEFRVVEEVGKLWEPRELVEIAEKERVFIEESVGGVTFSGGEPLMQPGFLAESLREMKNSGFHTAVDTSGLTARKNFKLIIDNTDIFLYDIKHLDNKKHKMLTGVENREILSNLDFLMSEGKKVIIRFPLIPGYNDDDDHLSQLVKVLSEYRQKGISRLNLLPYHNTGSSKYSRFGYDNRMKGTVEPEKQRILDISDILAESGISIKIGG